MIKSRIIYSTGGVNTVNNISTFKANSTRHSLIIGSDVEIRLTAGGYLVLLDSAPAGQFRHYVLTYEDYGDMLYRIDGYVPSGVTNDYLIETFNEERPQETP